MGLRTTQTVTTILVQTVQLTIQTVTTMPIVVTGQWIQVKSVMEEKIVILHVKQLAIVGTEQ